MQDRKDANPGAGRGVAIREFPLKAGFGEADYLLYVDGAAAGVIEAKKEGVTLTGVELQTQKYSEGVPAPRRPLPFLYQSTGIGTRFTNLLEPDARSRNVFAFHRPETLADWLTQELHHPGSTLRAKLPEQVRILPEIEWQLSDAEALATAVETQLIRASRLRQSILKRAFEGKLVPQDPNDEPASVLLERIRAERSEKQPVPRTIRRPRTRKAMGVTA